MLFILGGLNCSFSCKTVANSGGREASSWINTQTGAMTAVSSSNETTETGSKEAGDMILLKCPNF